MALMIGTCSIAGYRGPFALPGVVRPLRAAAWVARLADCLRLGAGRAAQLGDYRLPVRRLSARGYRRTQF